MPRCDLHPEACVAEHLAPRLDGRRTSDKKPTWAACCPAHPDEKRSLSISMGDRGQRIVWNCHRGCAATEVKKAMLAKRIASGCIPWNPDAFRTGDRKPVLDVTAQLEKLLSEQPNPVDFMIRAGELLWNVDDRTAAERAGISQATFYRHRARSKR